MFTKPQTFNLILVVVSILAAFVVFGAERLGIRVSPGLTAMAYAIVVAVCGAFESYAKKQEDVASTATKATPVSADIFQQAMQRLDAYLKANVPAFDVMPITPPTSILKSVEAPVAVALESAVQQDLTAKLDSFEQTLRMNQNELLSALTTKAEAAIKAELPTQSIILSGLASTDIPTVTPATTGVLVGGGKPTLG